MHSDEKANKILVHRKWYPPFRWAGNFILAQGPQVHIMVARRLMLGIPGRKRPKLRFHLVKRKSWLPSSVSFGAVISNWCPTQNRWALHGLGGIYRHWPGRKLKLERQQTLNSVCGGPGTPRTQGPRRKGTGEDQEEDLARTRTRTRTRPCTRHRTGPDGPGPGPDQTRAGPGAGRTGHGQDTLGGYH